MAMDPSLNNDTKKGLRARSLTIPAGPPMASGQLLPQAAIIDAQGQGAINAGMPFAGVTSRLRDNVRATTAPDAPATATPADPSYSGQDNIGQSNLAMADRLGKPLAAGVTRYNMDPGNEAQVYTTRGKDGSVVFTDNAKYAAANSAGGLRRGDVNANVLARTQGDRNGFEYAKSDLEQSGIPGADGAKGTGGLRRDQFQDFDPDMTARALAVASAGSGAQGDTGLSNRIDANVLRGRQFTQQHAAAAAGQLKPMEQIALLRAQASIAQNGERNQISRDQLAATNKGLDRQQSTEDRNAYNSTFTQYTNLQKAGDPSQSAAFLADKIPRDTKTFNTWKTTPEGQFVLNQYKKDVLIPGAKNSLFPIEFGDNAAADSLGYGSLALDNSGNFGGFLDKEGNVQYPSKRNALSRYVSTGRSIFGTPDNYDASINDISPEILKQLKLDANGK